MAPDVEITAGLDRRGRARIRAATRRGRRTLREFYGRPVVACRCPAWLLDLVITNLRHMGATATVAPLSPTPCPETQEFTP